MKILFLSDLLAYGGASKLIFDLLPRMKEERNECELLILTSDHSKYLEELEIQGIKVTIVPKSIRSHFSKILFIKNYIKKGKFDIIHANLFPMVYYCSIVKRMLGKKCPPLIMTEHSTDNKRRHKPYLRPLERFIYKKYNFIISISEKTQENLYNWLKKIDKKKFVVVENGIDIELFKKAESIPRQSLISDYKQGDVLLLMVGSYTPQKNHTTLIEALTQLPNQYKLILAGEGPLLNEIKSRAKKLRLEKRIAFLGFRKDVAQLMHSVDMLIIPSIWEGFGLIAAEGMACGLPIAASDVSGLSEIVGDAGIKFNPSKPAEIKDSIIRLSDQRIRKICVTNGFNRVYRYDIGRTVKDYLNIYRGFTGVK